jgi:membrane-associated HD superfamily phosphohydrolase
MTYFYQKAKDASDGKDHELSDSSFRYPGPKPQSKEAAILMMSDSIEAASRTLKDPSPAQISGMINRLVESMFTDNQFDECDITVREIGRVTETFNKLLNGIFHRRIDYPGYDFTLIDKRQESRQLSDSGSKQAKAI